MKEKLLQSLIDDYLKINNIIEKYKYLFNIDNEIFNTLSSLIDNRIKDISIILNDHDGWISWYIYDNQCGKNKFEAGYHKDLNKICNIQDLLILIENSNKKEK
jgi:hypothetical protein